MKYNFTAAVIGTGFMGKQHLEMLSKLVERVVICGNDVETGRALAEEYGCGFYADYSEMFERERLDFVSVCLPTFLHYDATVKALKKGINVLCEKPFASSVEEAEEMLSLSEENGKLLMIGHIVRFLKESEYIRRCVADERFGSLVAFSASREDGTPDWSVGNWIANASLSGGVIRDLHIHDTDTVVSLLGIPESVFAIGSDTVCRTLYKYGEVSAFAGAAWRTIGEAPSNRSTDVIFEKAWVKIREDKITVHSDGESFDPLENEEFPEYFGDDMLENEIRYFCHCLASGEKPSLCLPSDSLITMTVNAAEHESLKKGVVVTL